MHVRDLLNEYRSGERTPEETVERVYSRIDAADTNAWISVRDEDAVLADVEALDAPEEDPLYGVPFAVKDNVDVAGLPTTAGCPAYAYEPTESATVVSKLTDAGALLIGKTNMDQFASGLVGTRSPYGVCRNVYDEAYISGGSSSGSAVATADGHVAFALGTDTAGSGRVPAALNGLVGLKPSRGLLSTAGVVPACRSLDCPSIFAHTCRDALLVAEVAAGFDPDDPYSRRDRSLASTGGRLASLDAGSLTVGVPEPDALEFFGDEEAARLYEQARSAVEATVGDVVPVDFGVFSEAADLLYRGPWIAERLGVVQEFVDEHAEAVEPVVRRILRRGEEYSAVETFDALHELERLRRRREELFDDAGLDVLLTPTTGTVYTVSDVLERPVERNSDLGYYTDYVNLLDLSAVSVPAGRFEDGPGFGLTVSGAADDDRLVASAGRAISRAVDRPREEVR